jgi:electron transfer flavoprotein alpha subunit
VDLGLVPFERQIGQTGKSVSPKLIICCGISGAMEFIAGMRNAKQIIAVNTDENAPISKISDLMIKGDLHQLVPEMIKRLEAHLEVDKTK